jgi:hypothetical protein
MLLSNLLVTVRKNNKYKINTYESFTKHYPIKYNNISRFHIHFIMLFFIYNKISF